MCRHGEGEYLFFDIVGGGLEAADTQQRRRKAEVNGLICIRRAIHDTRTETHPIALITRTRIHTAAYTPSPPSPQHAHTQLFIFTCHTFGGS
jgi:hypothetical protein